jgi:hypothetical protein
MAFYAEVACGPHTINQIGDFTVKFRRAMVAVASTVAIGGLLLAGAAPAFASQTDAFYITGPSGGTRYFLIDSVDVQVHTAMIPTFWSDINGKAWSYKGGTRPTYEWKDDSVTGWCLTSEGSKSVILQPCRKNDKAELWWRNSAGQFINWQTTARAKNSDRCLNAEHLQDGSMLDVVACKAKHRPGWFDQYWKSVT